MPIVLVDFPAYQGVAYDQLNPTWVPIKKIIREFEGSKKGDLRRFSRTMLPLVNGESITIHSCQGIS